MSDVKSFILEAHDDAAEGIREMVLDDPELNQVAGATGPICCIGIGDQVFCGQDQYV